MLVVLPMSFAIYLIFLAGTYLRPFEVLLPSLADYRPMLMLSLLCMVVVSAAVVQGEKVAARPLHFALLGGFMVVIVLSLLVNGNGLTAAIAATTEFSFSAIMFCVTVMCVNTIERLRAACVVLALSMTVLSIAGIAAYYDGFMVDELVLRQGTELEGTGVAYDAEATPAEDDSGVFFWRVRSLGFLSDPNDFAQMLTVALPLIWALWTRRRWIRNLLFVLAPTIAIGWASYLTHSRGALVATAAVVFVGLQRRLGAFVSSLLIVLAAAGALVLNATGGRGFSSQEESAAGRIDAWTEGLLMFRSHPLFGVGYGNFDDYNPLTAHNSFVLCFSELGFVGYFLWMSLIVLALVELSSLAKRIGASPDQRLWGRAVSLGLIGFLVAAWFLSRTYQPCLYTVLGLAVAVSNLPVRAPLVGPALAAPGPARWQGSALLACIGGLVAVYASVVMQRLST